jgi:hypothetical protein
MRRVYLLIGGLLSVTTPCLRADEGPRVAPLEVGQWVKMVVGKQWRTAEGIRVDATRTEVAGKATLTVTSRQRGKGPSCTYTVEHLVGLVAALDDAWLTLDLSSRRPFLRIPREAIVRWETLGLPAQDAESPRSARASSQEDSLAVPLNIDHGAREKPVVTPLRHHGTAIGLDGFVGSFGAGAGLHLESADSSLLSLDVEAARQPTSSTLLWVQIGLRLNLAPHSLVSPFVSVALGLICEAGIRVQVPLRTRMGFFVEPALMATPGRGGFVIKCGVSTRL